MTKKQLVLIAAVLAALLAAPGLAWAQAAPDEGEADEPDEAAADAEEEEVAVVADEEPAEAPAEPAAPAAEPDKPSPVQGTWTKKIEFASEDGNFKFQPTGFVQPKLQVIVTPDETDKAAGSGFVFQRARLGFRATLFKISRLYLDADFKSGAANLVDFYADIDPFDGVLAVRAGWFRPWLSRQLLTATTQLQMIDYAKAWTDPLLGMGLDRDLGVGVFGMVANVFEYGLGVWNGEGGRIFDLGSRKLTDTVGTNGKPLEAPANLDAMFGGRLAVHPLGPTAIGRPLPLGDESDSAISAKPGLVLGVSALYNKRHDRVASGFECTAGVCTGVIPQSSFDALYYDNQLKLGVDLAFQMIGLSFVGEFFLHKVWLADDTAQEIQDAVALAGGVAPYPYHSIKKGAATGGLTDGLGFGTYAQVGYFVIAKKVEVAGRFDMVDENMDVRGSRMYPGFGGTYYFFGNNLKVQLMYRLGLSNGYGKIEQIDGADGDEVKLIDDPGFAKTSHEILLMLQGSI
jgi:hypothetical protein